MFPPVSCVDARRCAAPTSSVQYSTVQYSTVQCLLCRCTAVCSPYKYRERNLGNPTTSFYKLLAVILATSTAINVPRFFETNIVR